MVQQTLSSVVEASSFFSTNIYGYIIFISLIFIIAFMFVCWQVLNIFKSCIGKVLEVFEQKLNKIEKDVNDIKNKLDGR